METMPFEMSLSPKARQNRSQGFTPLLALRSVFVLASPLSEGDGKQICHFLRCLNHVLPLLSL
jgi:hypothetical protein